MKRLLGGGGGTELQTLPIFTYMCLISVPLRDFTTGPETRAVRFELGSWHAAFSIRRFAFTILSQNHFQHCRQMSMTIEEEWEATATAAGPLLSPSYI